ncbi:MAG: hypothetical protein QXY49_06430 [Thermofilaceae archaeon]
MTSGSTIRLTSSLLEKLLIVVLLIWAISASSLAAYNYLRAEKLASEVSHLTTVLSTTESELHDLRMRIVIVNIGIDYGNGTVKWFNVTPLSKGATVLKALLAVASRVEYTYGPWGAYVTSVNGVKEEIIASNEGYSWLWYIYDKEKGVWIPGPVASDQYELPDGSSVKWIYEHWKF